MARIALDTIIDADRSRAGRTDCWIRQAAAFASRTTLARIAHHTIIDADRSRVGRTLLRAGSLHTPHQRRQSLERGAAVDRLLLRGGWSSSGGEDADEERRNEEQNERVLHRAAVLLLLLLWGDE